MKDLGFFSKIFLAIDPVDFRKPAHSLALTVEHSMGISSLVDRTLFVFTNRSRTAVKILYWDKSGYALWWKSLEREKFSWPRRGNDGKRTLTNRELKWLLEGIDIERIEMHEEVRIHSL